MNLQVDSVLESLRSGITKDTNGVVAGIAACQTVRANLVKIGDDFAQHVAQIRTIIERIADELRTRVDEDEEKMITNLTVVRQKAADLYARDKLEVALVVACRPNFQPTVITIALMVQCVVCLSSVTLVLRLNGMF